MRENRNNEMKNPFFGDLAYLRVLYLSFSLDSSRIVYDGVEPAQIVDTSLVILLSAIILDYLIIKPFGQLIAAYVKLFTTSICRDFARSKTTPPQH